MNETMIEPPKAGKSFTKIFMTCMLVIVVLAMLLVTVAPYLAYFLTEKPLPEFMDTQSKVTFGVLLGAVLTMLKDYMGIE